MSKLPKANRPHQAVQQAPAFAALGKTKQRKRSLNERAFLVAMWLTVAAVPVERLGDMADFTVSHVFGLLAGILGVFTVLEHRSMRRITVLHLWLLAFIAYSALTLFWSDSDKAALWVVAVYVQLFIMSLLTWEYGRIAPARPLIIAFIAGCYISALSTFYSFISGQTISHRYVSIDRYTASGADPNDCALTLAIGIPLSLYLWNAIKGKSRWLFAAYPPLAILAIVFTASRGGLVCGIFAVSVLLFSAPRAGVGSVLRAIVVIGLAAVLSLAFIPPDTLKRFASIPDEVGGSTMALRTLIWQAGFEVWRTQPIFGIGAGNFKLVVSSAFGLERVAHNSFLEVLVECGVVGLAIFTGALAACARVVGRIPRPARLYWIFTSLTWGIGASLLSWEMHKVTWIILSICAIHSVELAKGRAAPAAAWIAIPAAAFPAGEPTGQQMLVRP